MPGPTPSQPGWYPDQNGTMRWFDGSSWTDHVQPGSAGLAEATVVGGAPPEPTRPLGPRPEDPPGWHGGPPSGQHTTPPPSPPSGQPVAPYGAVPQPSFPGGPGGPGPGGPGGPGFQPPSGGRNKGLLIVLALVGAIVLIAVLSVGAWAVFLRDDDGDGGNGDGGGGGGGDDSSLPDTGPEEVVEAFFDAAEARDCEAALALVSDRFAEENDANCDNEEDFMEAGEFEATVGEATIDEDADPPTAVVPVTLVIEGFGEQELPFGMVVEDDEWKIDSIEEPTESPEPSLDPPTSGLSVPSDFPSDLPSEFPSELPSGFPSDFPTDLEDLESYLSDYLTATP